MHRRKSETWNECDRSAAERFDELNSDEELEEWVEPLRKIAGEVENAYAFFNNNSSSDMNGTRVAQAAANADALRRLLAESEVPVS